jgi:DNA modification methylase
MLNWTKCYEDSWKDHIVPEAFSHPAKMAYGLLSRILSHAEEQGWLAPESVILDPFGGISTTGILGAYAGYQVITCELESRFTNLAMQNVKLHLNKWQKLKCPVPVIIQGDSRRLCELVEKADVIVSSPPFQGVQGTGSGELEARKGRTDTTGEYGNTPGQLGAMKPGKLDLILSSPPYAESLASDTRKTKNDTWKGQRPDGSRGGEIKNVDYGQTKGNLGNLKAGDVDCVISSPPYAETPVEQTHMTSNKRGDEVNPNYRPSWKKKLKEGYDKTKRPYGKTDGNLGNLKAGDVSLILSSPGYCGCEHTKASKGIAEGARKGCKAGNDDGGYNSDGNVSAMQGDTFWQAAKEILEQCFQILKPGGHAIWVCKDFVRKGKRVPFSDDWLKLCESVGFTLECRHQAMLVKEESHDSLFGGTITKKTERKSFFRRLAEAKGSPRIDHEDVICVKK